MTAKENELNIREAALYCKKSIPTIRGWIKHKARPLAVRRPSFHKTYIDKGILDKYLKCLVPLGRPSILPKYQKLKNLKKQHTAREISIKYNVSENAVWMALNRGKKSKK